MIDTESNTDIRPDVCPYFVAAWSMTIGCHAKCAGSEQHRAIVNAAVDEGEEQ